jgi:hypothetical protein
MDDSLPAFFQAENPESPVEILPLISTVRTISMTWVTIHKYPGTDHRVFPASTSTHRTGELR